MTKLRKIARMNVKQATEEMRKLEAEGQTQWKRYWQLKAHVEALNSRPFGVQEALRFIRSAGSISQTAFVKYARSRGLTRDGARTLFKEAALATA